MASVSKVYFATNRDPITQDDGIRGFGSRFNPSGPQFYRVGSAKARKVPADIDEGYEIDSIDVEEERPREIGVAQSRELLGSTALFTDLQADMRDQRSDAIVLVHGFASSFEDNLKRGAQIADAYTFKTVEGGKSRTVSPEAFVFSWPSDGELIPWFSYSSDRHDASFSGIAMARALARLLEFVRDPDQTTRDARDPQRGAIRCNRRLHLVAHSMGAWALRHALAELRRLIGVERLPRLFENIFLFAADEDADAFEHPHKLGLLPQLGRFVHVYHSHEDGALLISATSKLNGDRLGSIGPRITSGLPTNVVAIDCVAVDDSSDLGPVDALVHSNHQYYRRRPEVIADVVQVLAGARPENVRGRDTIEPGRRYRISESRPRRRTSG